MTEDLTCAICQNIYNSETRVPLKTPCNHIICSYCLQLQFKASRKLMCPFDRIPIQGRISDLQISQEHLPRNKDNYSDILLDMFLQSVQEKYDTIKADFTWSSTNLQSILDTLMNTQREILAKITHVQHLIQVQCQIQFRAQNVKNVLTQQVKDIRAQLEKTSRPKPQAQRAANQLLQPHNFFVRKFPDAKLIQESWENLLQHLNDRRSYHYLGADIPDAELDDLDNLLYNLRTFEHKLIPKKPRQPKPTPLCIEPISLYDQYYDNLSDDVWSNYDLNSSMEMYSDEDWY